jgi:glycosyltransferase involved in cell wall biosynthesis
MNVSVVVPVRDGERLLGAALESIAAQTRPPEEVVVVDDGSKDGSAALAAAHGARVERQAPAGQAAARNRGIALARGDTIAFLDADDLWPPDALERQAAALAARPEADLVFGRVRELREDGGDAPSLGPPQPGMLFGAMLARRGVFDRVGPLATQWRVGELMEWLLRAREAGVREVATEHVVLHRRVHDANLSRRADTRIDHVRILRQALARRRAG